MAILLIVFTGRQLIVLFIGAAFIGVGGLGLLTGMLDVKGRGPRRVSTGRSARVVAAVLVAFGGAMTAFAMKVLVH